MRVMLRETPLQTQLVSAGRDGSKTFQISKFVDAAVEKVEGVDIGHDMFPFTLSYFGLVD
ncbi:hypothetical protein D3C78_1791470 [compost metagenome]